jgi:hypothetical protein
VPFFIYHRNGLQRRDCIILPVTAIIAITLGNIAIPKKYRQNMPHRY